MKRSKSIDELYEEVREFDMVITNDAALATALNARIDEPIVGYFALTPKQIAGSVASRILGSPLYSELSVISTISEETGLRLKYVHSEVENIREIRKYTADVQKHLHTKTSRSVYDSFEALPTLERAMGAFIPDNDELYRGVKVAVIEDFLFNDLDKHFIPIDYEPISIFADDDYQIDTIYEIGNDRQLAQNAVDLIDPEKPTDYAIVLNTASPVTDAVRSAMYRKRIPFINALNVRDLSQIRDYLRFISLSMDFETIRVKNVKELFSNYNGTFWKGREEFLLCRQGPSDMSDRGLELWTTMKDVRSMTFGEVCEIVCNRKTKVQVNNMITELGVKDQKVSSELLNEVIYAVDNVKQLSHNEEIPEYEKKGVLIVDCNNSIYIDRPVVIYLGMEQDWNRSVIGKPYLDAEDETDKNVTRLNALLQQGNVRYYLVNSTKGGKPAKPSTLFDLLYKRPIESFSDMCGHLVKGRWHTDEEVITPESDPVVGADPDCYSDPFSKSSFNSYFSCPRKFLYSTLLKTPEEKDTEFGTLIHSFAEFYICYPEDVKELGVDHFVHLISDKYTGLSSPLMESLDSDKVRQAMNTIIAYLDSIGITNVPLDTPLSLKKNPNRFMVAMGKEMTSSLCEREIQSHDHPVYGQLDLTWNGIITDYKTGRPHTGKEISDAMTMDPVAKYPEFQAPIYLTLMKEDEYNKGRFDLFYAMDNDVSLSTGKVSVGQNIRSVVLIEGSVKETLVNSEDVRDYLSDNMSAKLKNHAAEILQVISEMASDDPAVWDKDEGLQNRVLEIAEMSQAKSNRDTVAAGLRKIAKLVKGGLIVVGDRVEVPSDTLDTIMGTIDRMHDEMVQQSRTGFPPTPHTSCEDCQYFSVCTKDIIVPEADSDE